MQMDWTVFIQFIPDALSTKNPTLFIICAHKISETF